MKKLLLSFFIIATVLSCKNDSKGAQTIYDESELTTIEGYYLHYDDAAVFQTKSSLYGVVQNQKMQELNKQAQPLKNETTDQVAVTVKGKLSKKPAGEEGWEDRIEIVEIIKVSKISPEENEVVKLGTNQ